GDEEQKELILRNMYTRGQIQVFAQTEKQLGFGDIVDWMRAGSDPLLQADDLSRVRNLEPGAQPAPRATAAWTPPVAAQPPPAADLLMLKAVFWGQRPSALINDRTFEPNERARVRLANTNLLVLCLDIRTNSVVIQVEGAATKQELFLPSRR